MTHYWPDVALTAAPGRSVRPDTEPTQVSTPGAPGALK